MKYIILRNLSLNSVNIETDRFFGVFPSEKQASDVAFQLHDQFQLAKQAAVGLNAFFYVKPVLESQVAT
jgi:hypothetical protein